MQHEKDTLIIPFMGTMPEEEYYNTYFVQNSELKTLLWERRGLLDEFDRSIKELRARSRDVGKDANGLFVFRWFEWIPIVKLNRSVRAGNTAWALGFLEDCLADINDRLERLKNPVSYPPVTANATSVLDDIPDWLRSETDPPPTKVRKQAPVNTNDIPDWLNSAGFVIPEDSPYVRRLIQSVHKPLSSPSVLEEIPADERFAVDDWMRDCATMSKADRHLRVFHNHKLVYNDNIVRENLRFFIRNGFSLIVYERMLERFIGLVNRYGDWLDFWYILLSAPIIDSSRPLTDDMKRAMTWAYAYLLDEDYDTVFDTESNLKDGIDETYLAERLRTNGVLTDDGPDYERIERIIAGYE